MNPLVFYLAIGAVLFVTSIYVLIRVPPREQVNSHTMEVLVRIVPLPGLEFPHASTFFQETDYDWVLRTTGKRHIAKQLERDRRRLALTWLRQVQEDVLALWRFRRYLTLCGMSATIGEELSIGVKAVQILVYLEFLRIFVALFGPFALARLVPRVRGGARGFSQSCGAVLGRIPMYKLAELASAWQKLQSAEP